MIELKGKFNTAKVFTDNIEETAIGQIIELCNQEFSKGSQIRIMPDVHAGAGCTIGTTMTLGTKIVPNLVGVDIACGMKVVKLREEDGFDVKELDEVIEKYVPSGFNVRQEVHFFAGFVNFDRLRCSSAINVERAKLSIGTLGGGNHFIEVCTDDSGDIYVVIHTGSRNFGKQIAEYYQDLAFKTLNNRTLERDNIVNHLKAKGKEKEIESALAQFNLPKFSKALSWLEGGNLDDYLNDIQIAQEFALWNRSAIVSEIFSHIKTKYQPIDVFDTIHNYIDVGAGILRKGAVSAYENERLIIPMNMRDGSLICVGKGNSDWNYSAPHGAGRIMSRSKAKELVTLDEFEKSMEGIYTTSVNKSTLDEAPMAYKPMEEIISCIGDTVDIVSIIKPIYNFKAGEKNEK